MGSKAKRPNSKKKSRSKKKPKGNTATEEEGECTPPFSLSYEGAEHEVAVCFEAAGGETRLYLLLDGALIDVDVP